MHATEIMFSALIFPTPRTVDLQWSPPSSSWGAKSIWARNWWFWELYISVTANPQGYIQSSVKCNLFKQSKRATMKMFIKHLDVLITVHVLSELPRLRDQPRNFLNCNFLLFPILFPSLLWKKRNWAARNWWTQRIRSSGKTVSWPSLSACIQKVHVEQVAKREKVLKQHGRNAKFVKAIAVSFDEKSFLLSTQFNFLTSDGELSTITVLRVYTKNRHIFIFVDSETKTLPLSTISNPNCLFQQTAILQQTVQLCCRKGPFTKFGLRISDATWTNKETQDQNCHSVLASWGNFRWKCVSAGLPN